MSCLVDIIETCQPNAGYLPRYLPFKLQRLEQPVKPMMAEPDRGASGRLSVGGIINNDRKNHPSSASHKRGSTCPSPAVKLSASPSPLPISLEADFSTAAHCRNSLPPSRHLRVYPRVASHQHPLTPPLDELVQQQGQVLQDKPADVKGKELGSVPSAELEPDLRLVCVSEAWVFHLAGNLV